MPRPITPWTTLEGLRKEAKRWLRTLRANDEEAQARFRRALPNGPEAPTLRDVQHALAVEHGFPGWTALRQRLAADTPLDRYERVAHAVIDAYRAPDESAMRVVWDYFGHMRTWDAMRRYMRLDLGKREQPRDSEDDTITLEEARSLVARAQGFESWDELVSFARSVPAGSATIAAKSVSAYVTGASGEREIVARSRDWDEIIDVIRQRGLVGLHAEGQMTDELLERISRLGHLTALDLSASQHLSDHGLRHLARLTRLEHLDLSGCPITDRGLEVLRRLPALERIELAWTRVTDAGMAHLASCERLRAVNLTGTATGDGAIRALAGKRDLADLRSGNGVTDAGLALVRDLPIFASWQDDEPRAVELGGSRVPNFLSLRGPFTNAGLARLVALDGLYALDLDDDHLAVTGAGLAPLVDLPHLEWLGFDAKDESMPYIAALPRLRRLMCQDTQAGDDGFVALSRSRSIEHVWGRRCYNLRRRGFVALAEMPALRYLSVSCRNVDDVGISALPHFPALRELMPMDVPDDGYRHVGRCQRLESLVLMYCRETTDAATEHITRLGNLRKYFASYNLIADRTPELLSDMDSLEEVTFDTCAHLTNAGVAALARLPRLRTLAVSGMPRVTREVVRVFGGHVRIRYAP